MSKPSLTAAIVLGALIAVAIGLLLSRSKAPPARHSPDTPAMTTPVAPASIAPERGLPARVPARRALAPGGSVGAAAAPVAPADPDHRERYRRATDLAPLVEELNAAAAAGDGDAMGLIARAYDECANFEVAEKYSAYRDRRAWLAAAAERMSESERNVLWADADIEQGRCAGLPHGTDSLSRELRAMNARAVELGSAHALATWQLPGADSPGAMATLRGIVASGDAEAIAAMAGNLVLGGDEDRHWGPYFSSEADRIAWNLVACRLGRDCGPRGAPMRALCLDLGMCMDIDYVEYLRIAQATPLQFEQARATADEIVALLAAGNVDALFPGD